MCALPRIVCMCNCVMKTQWHSHASASRAINHVVESFGAYRGNLNSICRLNFNFMNSDPSRMGTHCETRHCETSGVRRKAARGAGERGCVAHVPCRAWRLLSGEQA
eukprot:COSAG06_NODE_454_length_15536_cov_23.174257_15_plen_106_part_00